MGIDIVSKITGDSRCSEITEAPKARLNIVQCAGSMTYLAKRMEAEYGIPYIKVSFFGIEDTKDSLLRTAEAVGSTEAISQLKQLMLAEELNVLRKLKYYKDRVHGKKAAIYVGGGFKAISLIKQFAELGMKTVMVGTQTGKADDYEIIRSIVDDDTVILDDANPSELEKFMKEKGADILVGGVKERPLAYKLGVAFCDHNHERKHPLCGFEGSVNFAQEVEMSINSPVWKFICKKLV
jgi:nitrogenase molybdenum-cofactor synthesis protein NifE